jgi:hypothetical protein
MQTGEGTRGAEQEAMRDGEESEHGSEAEAQGTRAAEAKCER